MTRRLLAIVVVPLAAVVLAACGGSVSDEYVIEEQPYTLEPVEGQDVLRVILEESAVERLGIETASVEERGAKLGRCRSTRCSSTPTEISGCTRIRSPSCSSGLRSRSTHETVTEATLSDGPPAGTEVVTVGIPELYGTETGFGT